MYLLSVSLGTSVPVRCTCALDLFSKKNIVHARSCLEWPVYKFRPAHLSSRDAATAHNPGMFVSIGPKLGLLEGSGYSIMSRGVRLGARGRLPKPAFA